MFAVGPVISYKQRGCEPAVVTYNGQDDLQGMASVWLYVWTDVRLDRGILCALWAIRQFYIDASLSLLYCGLGVSINGIILREKWMIYSPVVAFVLVIHADEFDKS